VPLTACQIAPNIPRHLPLKITRGLRVSPTAGCPLGVPYCDRFLGGVVEQLLDAGADTSKALDEPPVVDLSECHYLARMAATS
jgi:hypothetical protein